MAEVKKIVDIRAEAIVDLNVGDIIEFLRQCDDPLAKMSIAIHAMDAITAPDAARVKEFADDSTPDLGRHMERVLCALVECRNKVIESKNAMVSNAQPPLSLDKAAFAQQGRLNA